MDQFLLSILVMLSSLKLPGDKLIITRIFALCKHFFIKIIQ